MHGFQACKKLLKKLKSAHICKFVVFLFENLCWNNIFLFLVGKRDNIIKKNQYIFWTRKIESIHLTQIINEFSFDELFGRTRVWFLVEQFLIILYSPCNRSLDY
jgi:hypothetical protein